LAGGINLYGYANGDPIMYSDPYGLSADTIVIEKELRPFLDECARSSATCRREIDAKATSGEWWFVKIGQPGDCAPFVTGCTQTTPSPGGPGGGTITIIPGEMVGYNFPLDPSDGYSPC